MHRKIVCSNSKSCGKICPFHLLPSLFPMFTMTSPSCLKFVCMCFSRSREKMVNANIVRTDGVSQNSRNSSTYRKRMP